MPYSLDPNVRHLIKRWIRIAVESYVVDALYTKYYEPKICPLGYAGENCTMPCNPQYGRSDRLGVCICDSTKYRGSDCSTVVEEAANDVHFLECSLYPTQL